MQIQSVGQWAGQKQQWDTKTHTRGTPGDGPCQPPDRGTNQHPRGSAPISSDPGSGVTCQASWDVQSSMLKCLLLRVFCLLFYTDTTAQGQCACSWRRAGQPRAPELCYQEQRVEPEMSLLPGTYSHHDSTTHGLPRQCPQEAVLHAFFWLLSTTWLVLTPQPHYRVTLWRGQEISFQLHNLKTDLNGVCNWFFFTITDGETIIFQAVLRIGIAEILRYAWGFLEMMLITITTGITDNVLIVLGITRACIRMIIMVI